MSEIWNLSSLCRFCHNDGNFRKFTIPNKQYEKNESYGDLLQKTFNITMTLPAGLNASDMICDECILSLTEAAKFKDQVQACEDKFQEYIKNEFFTQGIDVKDFIPIDSKNADGNNHGVVKLEPEFDETLQIKIEKTSISEDEDDKFCENNNDKEPPDGDVSFKLDLTPQEKVDVVKNDKTNFKITKTMIKEIKEKNNKITFTSDITCYVCFKSLSRTELTKHLETHKELYRCKYCEHELPTYDTLLFHIKKEHKQNLMAQYTCNFCQRSLKTEKSLSFHLDKHFRQKVFECDICHKVLKYRSKMVKHIPIHDPDRLDKIHQCQHCGWRFAERTSCVSHIKAVHELIRDYACTSCPSTFATKKNLVKHFRIHTGERPYECETCRRRFRVLEGLKRHQNNGQQCNKVKKEGKKNKKNIYRCKTCNVKFDHKGLYMEHLRSHPETACVCDQCGLVVVSYNSLLRHRLTHAQPRFACETCGAKYKVKAQLERHVKRIHLNIKVEKSKCEVCGKLVVNLKQHLLTHNSRRFTCTFCKKTYSERKTLTRHLKESHSGHKLYGCDVCGKRYTTKRNLLNHNLKCRKV